MNNLVLYFTRGISLDTWVSLGSVARETLLYNRLADAGYRVTFVTHGSRVDRKHALMLKDIRIICNRFNLPRKIYEMVLSNLIPLSFSRRSILKSNQVRGAEFALSAAKLIKCRFIARCGYLPSNIAAWNSGPDTAITQKMQRLESKVFRGADIISVTTPAMKKTLIDNYEIPVTKIHIIPNYVDTELFKPSADHSSSNKLLYIGRLEKEKNIMGLVRSIRGLDVELMVIGTGSLREQLEMEGQRSDTNIRLIGNVPNSQLPDYLNTCDLFVQPSFLEHHPKAILEAMSCGVPVLGTDVYGIKDVIKHRENGYLCETSPEAIRDAILSILKDDPLKKKIRSLAREYALEHVAFDKVFEKELALLSKVYSS